MQSQEICKTCGTKLVIKETKRKPSQLKQPYYYTAYYFCPKCQKLYHDEKFKVVNNQTSFFEASDGIEAITVLAGKTALPTTVDVEIWTDGACVNNGRENARAAWSFVSGATEQAGRVVGKQTNNIAEALGIYYGLLWAANNGHKKIKIHSDSQITLNNLKKPVEQVKANAEIFALIHDVIIKNDLQVIYEKVLGHSGDPNNERADKLANSLAASSATD